MLDWLVDKLKGRIVGLIRRGERIGIRLGEMSRLQHRVGEVCFGLVLLGLFLLWFDPVCTPGFNAWTFPLLQPARMWPHFFTPLSYALPAVILCAVGCLSWRLGRGTIVLWVIFFLWLLGLTFFLEITCWQPSWLKAAAEGATDFQRCYEFEVAQSLPDVVAGAPAEGLTGVIDGLLMRFGAGVAALSYGWYFFMFSTLLCFAAGFARFNFWPKLKSAFLPAIVFFSLSVGVQVWRPIYGEVQIASGSNAAAAGRLADALAHFRRAIAVDEWNRLQSGVYAKVGALYEMQGQRNQPEYHVYRALRFEETADMQQALFEWDQAMLSAEPRLAPAIRKEIVNLTQVYGNQLYARGELGEARKMLELSTSVEPNQLFGYYLGGMCCFEMADYHAAIDRFNQALLHTSEPSLIADTRSSLGDCYFKIGDVETARRYYMASMAADNEHNYRALKSLTERYYR